MAWGDYNNDGAWDVFISGLVQGASFDSGAAVTVVSKLFKNVGGTFVEDPADSVFLPVNGAAAWIDYDNDGLLDLLVGGSPDGGHTFVTNLYRNTGSGFVQVPCNIPGFWGGSIAVGDYNNDGNMDVMVNGYGGFAFCSIYKNVVATSVTVDSLGDAATVQIRSSNCSALLYWCLALNIPTKSLMIGDSKIVGCRSGLAVGIRTALHFFMQMHPRRGSLRATAFFVKTKISPRWLLLCSIA